MKCENIDLYHEDILKRLRDIVIFDFKEYRVDKLLYNQISFALTREKSYLILTIIASIFFDRETVDVINPNSDLLLYSEIFNRNDHDSYWEDIKNIFEDKCSYNITNLCKKNILNCFKPFKILKKIKRLRLYANEISFIDSTIIRFYLSAQLVWLFEFDTKLKMSQISPKVAMCFCDADFHEVLMVQWLNSQGVITITNQHGQPLIRNIKMDRLNQSQILNSNSRYFFAKGVFTKEQFLKIEPLCDGVKVVGDIQKKNGFVYNNRKKKNRFCVFLDCPIYPFSDKTNLNLLKLANLISKKEGIGFFVKIHPSDNKKKYYGKLGTGILVDKDISLNSVFEMIDFGLFSASAIYIDMIANSVKPYQFCEENFPITEFDEDIVETPKDFFLKQASWDEKDDYEKESLFRERYKRYFEEVDAELEIKRFVNAKLLE